MSEQKHGHRTERMPLPSPRSTRELDDKILAYARDNAPRQRTHRPARWAAGLATAGIVAVAVLIALPQKPVPQLTKQVEERSSIAQYQAVAPVASMKMTSPVLKEEISSLEEYAREPAPAARELASAGTSAVLDEEQLHEQLKLCAELLEAGHEAQARATYQALREHSPACELPESLEEAIEQDLPTDTP